MTKTCRIVQHKKQHVCIIQREIFKWFYSPFASSFILTLAALSSIVQGSLSWEKSLLLLFNFFFPLAKEHGNKWIRWSSSFSYTCNGGRAGVGVHCQQIYTIFRIYTIFFTEKSQDGLTARTRALQQSCTGESEREYLRRFHFHWQTLLAVALLKTMKMVMYNVGELQRQHRWFRCF